MFTIRHTTCILAASIAFAAFATFAETTKGEVFTKHKGAVEGAGPNKIWNGPPTKEKGVVAKVAAPPASKRPAAGNAVPDVQSFRKRIDKSSPLRQRMAP